MERQSKRGLLRVDVKKIEKNRMRKIKQSIKLVKKDMVRITTDHKRFAEAHQRITLQFKALDSECETLKEGADAIALQNSENQKRIDLLFAILRARERNDFSAADQLVLRLREISEVR